MSDRGGIKVKKNKKIVSEFAPHQYSEAVVTTLLNYLRNKEIIEFYFFIG